MVCFISLMGFIQRMKLASLSRTGTAAGQRAPGPPWGRMRGRRKKSKPTCPLPSPPPPMADAFITGHLYASECITAFIGSNPPVCPTRGLSEEQVGCTEVTWSSAVAFSEELHRSHSCFEAATPQQSLGAPLGGCVCRGSSVPYWLALSRQRRPLCVHLCARCREQPCPRALCWQTVLCSLVP